MNIQLPLVPLLSSNAPAKIHSDLINGGQSVTKLNYSGTGIKLECKIILSNTFAFCGVEIPLIAPDGNPVDLSRYTQLELDLSFNSEQSDSLLVYLNNKEELINQEPFIRANMLAVSPLPGKNHFSLTPGRFFVPSWWVYQNAQPGLNTEPDIKNVVSLSLTTGDNTQARNVQIIVHKITFYGKWLADDDLYSGLLIGWMILVALHGLRYINSLRTERSQLEQLAKKDKLTGAWNRAGAKEPLEVLAEEYKNSGKSSTLLLLDIDHFKKINDEFGHNAGDSVLIKIVQVFYQSVRKSDLVVRWGGEEFLIALTETDLKTGQKIAEKIRSSVENASICNERPITCSIGIAEICSESIDKWIKRADEAMYQAKRAGRNRIFKAEE